MADPPPTTASAAGAAPRAGGARRLARAWAVLDRTPKLVDRRDDLPATDADYTVLHAAPPGLSTLLLTRTLVPLGDHVCRVECAREGSLLVSVQSAHGGPRGAQLLLVCLAGSRRACQVPRVPAALGVLQFGVQACTGILPAGCGHYVLAQLQRSSASPPSSSSSSSSASTVRHRVLLFASSSTSWTARDVAADLPRRLEERRLGGAEAGWNLVEDAGGQEPLAFEAHTALAHDDGKQVLFVDLKRGVILFLEPRTATASFVSFPKAEDDGGGELDLEMAEAAGTRRSDLAPADVEQAARHRAVGFSEGRLYAVQVSSAWRWVTVSRLRRHGEWKPMFRVSIHEVFWKEPEIGRRASLAATGVGPIDPTNRNKIIIYEPNAVLGFTVVVNPRDETLRRVQFGEQADAASRGSCLDVLVWRFDQGDPAAVAQAAAGTAAGSWRWVRNIAIRTRSIGSKAVKTCRKHVDKLPLLAPFVGGAAAHLCGGGSQIAAAVAGTAAGLVTANNAAAAGEEISRHVGTWWASGPDLEVEIVSNLTEADRLIREWKARGRPRNMVADVPSGLDQNQVDELRRHFDANDAKDLPFRLSDFVMVERALHF